MKAVWLENQQVSLRADLPAPELRLEEVLVCVRLAGVCATDLEMMRGYYPFTGILGHEFVGEVAELGPGIVDASWLGKRVVGEINLACGECEACRMGNPTHCENRQVIGIKNRAGAFAEWIAMPLANLHPVPDAVADEMAVFAEPLAAALEIQQQSPVLPDERVLVIGAGRLGQLVSQVLALSGCKLWVVARHPKQQALLQARGIPTLTAEDVQPRRWDVVVEATGSPGGFELARHAVRPRGKFILKSTYRGEITTNLSAVVVDEITLIGSRCGPFAPALRLMESGRVDPRPLIEATYPLDEAVQALEHATQPGVLKVLIRPS